MVSFSNGLRMMFCSRKIVPPGSVMRLRLVANSLAAIGKRVGQDVEIGILEKLDQRVRRRAAIDDDAFAWRDELRRRARDRPLLGDAHILAHRERHADQMRLMPRTDGFGAATNPLHFAFLGERVDVAPNGGFGCSQQIEQVADAHDGTLIDELQNQVMALFFQHGVTLDLIRDRL